MLVLVRLIAAFLATLLAVPTYAGVLITIDKSAQRMTVEVDGVPRYQWPISSGRRGYATPGGSFTPFRLEEDHYSKEWDEAPMPHSIFFTREGHAIHGTLEVKRLGSAASHGCVRLAPANAATLFALVRSEGLAKSKVVVTGVEPATVAGKQQAPPRDVAAGVVATRNWDDIMVREDRPPQRQEQLPFFGGAPSAWPPFQRY
jgi:hypothetical protein